MRLCLHPGSCNLPCHVHQLMGNNQCSQDLVTVDFHWIATDFQTRTVNVNIWVRCFSKSGQRLCVSDFSICTFWKAPHSIAFQLAERIFLVCVVFVCVWTSLQRSFGKVQCLIIVVLPHTADVSNLIWVARLMRWILCSHKGDGRCQNGTFFSWFSLGNVLFSACSINNIPTSWGASFKGLFW